jgi:nitrogen fixation/metabolism regulation signal transduction histidine kinase
MEHEDALALLQGGNSRERLEAARQLRRQPRPGDRETLARAARSESIPRIRALIEETIDFLTPVDVENDEGMAARDSAARAVKETTSKIVHEVRKLLPPLRLAAERDVPTFDGSGTKEYIDRLDSLVDAIDRLGRAASAPVTTDFDLAALVEEVVAAETEGNAVAVLHHGPSPMLVLGDRGHIFLALANGLRNAIESSIDASNDEPPSVVVSWDQTDSHYWVVVLDRGVGLPAGSHRAFEFGRTSKPKHDGVGLAIAKQAIESLGGDVQLRPREGGGASYEIRWPSVAS